MASRSGEELERSTSNPDMRYLSEISSRSLDRVSGGLRMEIHEMSQSYTGRDGQVRLLHEEIALHWVVATGSSADLSMTNSWFLFDLMIKSMIEHLDITDGLNSLRKGRFPHQFTDDIATVVHLVTSKVIGFHSSDAKQAQSLNTSLAFFVFDLLSIMDRGFVFGLIKIYFKILNSKNASIPDLTHYKIDFLRVVCSHEHFVALNLPFGTPYTALSAPCSPTPSVTSNNSQNSYLSTLVSSLSFLRYVHKL